MIHRGLIALLDVLFPPSDEVRRLRPESIESFQRFFSLHKTGTTVALSHYQEPLVRAAIHAHKFEGNTHATQLLSALLIRGLATLPNNTYLVPIPLSKKRQRERGQNQVTSLLSQTVAQSRIYPLLIRTRNTAEQSHLPRQKRLQNIKNCFAFNTEFKPEQFTHGHIVIVDDVVTTGATLSEAAVTLRTTLPDSTTISCLAIAH